MSPNQGVAQGSIISPALFDIYIEELLRTIERTPEISLEDILTYADDLLVLCDSIEQLKSVLKVIKKWSEENNLKLNPNKSGIVELCSRRQRPILNFDSLDEIPVLEQYISGINSILKTYNASPTTADQEKSYRYLYEIKPFSI